jgi:hypothetical protein
MSTTRFLFRMLAGVAISLLVAAAWLITQA